MSRESDFASAEAAWLNGPDCPEGDDCPDCGGSGRFDREEGCIDGLYYPAVVDGTCETCGGSGVVEPSDYEPDMPEFV